MTDYVQVYDNLRDRVSALVRNASDDEVAARCPAAPEWRVRDVVAHVSGVSADIVNGNLDGIGTDSWTAKQVADRRDLSIEQLLADWEEQAAAMAAIVPDLPDVPAGQWVTDALTHEHDIRGGLRRPGARDSDAIDLAFNWSRLVLDPKQPVRLESEAGAVQVGESEPIPTVRTTRFEFIRSMTGRRSLDQMRAYDWDGKPCPERLLFLIFTPRQTPLTE
jgi:uncharacterized protein (TIGR03083 family)